MVSEKLLTSKGTISGVLSLTSDQSHHLENVTEHMDVASSTARSRLEDLEEAGIVKQTAELVDGDPKRVYELTEEGQELAGHLKQIID